MKHSCIVAAMLIVTVTAFDDARGLSLLPVTTAPQISDDAINQTGERVMNGNDFRSVRRQVLQTTPVESNDDGFLVRSLSWMGEKVRNGLNAIGDFFDWVQPYLCYWQSG